MRVQRQFEEMENKHALLVESCQQKEIILDQKLTGLTESQIFVHGCTNAVNDRVTVLSNHVETLHVNTQSQINGLLTANANTQLHSETVALSFNTHTHEITRGLRQIKTSIPK